MNCFLSFEIREECVDRKGKGFQNRVLGYMSIQELVENVYIYIVFNICFFFFNSNGVYLYICIR